MSFYNIHLPADGTQGHCLATFATSITAIGLELGRHIDKKLSDEIGPTWFADLEAFRAANNKKHVRSRSFMDFSWVVNEPLNNSTSPVRACLPRGKPFYDALYNLKEARNRWFHDYQPHNLTELRTSLSDALFIAETCGLGCSADIKLAQYRVEALLSGSTFSEASAGTLIAPGRQTFPEQHTFKQKAVGARWLGPMGTRKITLSKSGALIDQELGANVSSELSAFQRSQYLELWKLILGESWLWVDSAGFVGSYVGGEFRTVGTWGENVPDFPEDPFAKFRLNFTYTLNDGRVVCRETGEALKVSNLDLVTMSTLNRVKAEISDGEIFRCTWDGELIAFTDDGPVYFGEVESTTWFKAHFLIPTYDENKNLSSTKLGKHDEV